MGPVEVVVVDNKKISCNGDKGSSRHPLIYLNMGEKNEIDCPYCSRHFQLEAKSDTTLKSNFSN